MNKVKINNYIHQYFQDCRLRKRLSEKTMKAYKADLQQYLEFIDKEWTNTGKIQEYIHTLNRKYPKYKTVKRKVASIKAFYMFLEYEEIIEFSPFRKIRTQGREQMILPKTISSKNIEEIFFCVYNDVKKANTGYTKKISVRNAGIIELLFSTGIRISELCNIKKESIDFNEGVLKIFGKGSKERILQIGNFNVIKILKRYGEINTNDSEYFFTNKFNEPLSEQAVRNLITNIEKRIGLSTHITPHMFRHTFATRLLEKGVDIRYIQRILGHSSISITQIYTHVSYPKQKEILTLKNPRNDYQCFLQE